MCGICGFIHKHKISDESLKKMSDTIAYRGPNDEGIYIEDCNQDWQLGLAHKRLSILDLSEAGHQPMLNKNGTIIVCYNGEIYNFLEIKKKLQNLGYIFKSNCDTEVILYAYEEWGIDCIKQFNGMFAISLYDKNVNEFYLIRDRLGIKPLYYYENVGEIVFASELKPIMEYPFFNKEINQNALGLFLANKYIAGNETIFKKVYKLLPGHYLCWRKGEYRVEQYWNIAENLINVQTYDKMSYEDSLNRLQNLVQDSVQKRMISDVPIGCFLSGGIDSSLVAAVMQEQSTTKIKTFTIGFDEKEYNEADYAGQVANAIGTEHYCEYLPMSMAKEYIDSIPLFYDEPMADESQIATMMLSRITKNKVTVALSGDGGDELFCGYIKYGELKQFNKFRTVSALLNEADKVFSLKGKLPRKINKMMYFNTYDNMINSDFYTYWDQYRDILNIRPDNSRYLDMLKVSECPEKKYMLMDMMTYLPDDILTKVDRASMAVSLESRNPLLDYRIAEYALSLPIEYVYYQGNKKRILKDLTYRYIGRKIMERPKKGFGVPVKKWLRSEWKTMTKGLLDEDYIQRQGIFNYSEVKKIIQQFNTNRDNKAGDYIWTLLVFQLWWDYYMK